ncbi:MAG: response regulator transcription factor [Chloroflexota bacterium]|nr:response regulator transcription factor [Chloroflexota bacterium]
MTESAAFTVLVADDERDIADLVGFGARINWPDCRVVTAHNGSEALEYFGREQPDLVVLDIMMPPPDGFEVCRRIRETSQVPILMLTARDATADKIRALDLGADDYLTKPFEHLELLARLKALARRAQLCEAPSPEHDRAQSETRPFDLVFGDLAINSANREVYLQGAFVPLTSTEYRLLEELARNAGTVLTHQALLERVWGPEYVGEDHYLKVFVRRLRRKLADNADAPRFIQTEWGVGYRFVPMAGA